MSSTAEKITEKREAVVIKKYANRRLYNTETSAYVTLDDLATMVRGDRDFVVYDAKTGEDLTHSVLTQIIVEQEGRQGGQTLLPIPFLRQLIRFYDDAMGKMVPSYLQFSMENLAKEQERFRSQFAHMFTQVPFGTAAFEAMQEQTRKNMQMFEQALAMWNPFTATMQAGSRRPSTTSGAVTPTTEVSGTSKPASAGSEPTANDLSELKAELARMQAKIEKLSQGRG
jgi:polyhydroxyalkanoate synthesis repressor PhaR